MSIFKTWTTRRARDKSVFFLPIIPAGYVSDILLEVTGGINRVMYLYILNMLMVCVDLALTVRYRTG